MKTINLDKVNKESLDNHTSKGNQPKWHHEDCWYKADHLGYEALSEVLISSLVFKSNIEDYVIYEPIQIKYQDKELVGCYSKNFLNNDEQLIPLEKLHRSYFGYGLGEAISKISNVEEKIKYTVQFVQEKTGLSDFDTYLVRMLELDAIMLNEDRHSNNIAVIRNDTTGAFSLCPIFDNGCALLSDMTEYELSGDIYKQIERVEAKPFTHKIDDQIEALYNIYKPQLKLHFTKKDVDAILIQFEGLYSEQIINRVRNVIFEQMRKYNIK